MAKKLHRQRFVNTVPVETKPGNVVPLYDREKLYGAFIEKNDAGFDCFVFRFASKVPLAKPQEIFGAASWTAIQLVAKPFGDAVFMLTRGTSDSDRRQYIGSIGWFLAFLCKTCERLNISADSFLPEDLITLHLRQYIAYINTIKTDKGKLLSVLTKRLYYRRIVRVIGYLQAHTEYKKIFQPPAYLTPPATPWSVSSYTANPKEGLSIAGIAELQDACEAECLKWLHLREKGQRLITEGSVLLAHSSGSMSRIGRSDEQRLAIVLAYLAKDDNLCEYLRDRVAWSAINSQCTRLLLPDHKSVLSIMSYICATARTLIPFYLLLALKTAFNRSTMDDLSVDAVRMSALIPNSATIDSRYAVVGTKKRSVRDQVRTYRLNDPDDQLNPIAIINHVIDLTRSIRSIADQDSAHMVFLYPRKAVYARDTTTSVSRVRQPNAKCDAFKKALDDFLTENALPKIRIDQLRPSMSNFSDVITGGDIIQQKELLNHQSITTTDTFYTAPESRLRQRERLADIQNNQQRFVVTNGQYDPRNLVTTGTAKAITQGFECSDPYDPPVAGQRKGRPCDAYGECPIGPLSSVDTKDPAAFAYLLRFDISIEDGKDTMNDHRWLHKWSPIQEKLHVHMAKFTDSLVLSDARKITLRPLPPVE